MGNSFLYTVLQQKILPAVTFSSSDEVIPVAEAILKGGLHVMEIPFRTAVAASSVTRLRKKFPEMQIGAGTLLSVMQMKEAIDAGAQFGLAPGFNPTVCKYAEDNQFPFVPGVMSPSEIELAAEMGFKILKLFPAAQLDGVAFLKAMYSTYTLLDVKFIPMGGVTVDNMQQYLALQNVIAVGGTWLTAGDIIATKQFEKITERVEKALSKTK